MKIKLLFTSFFMSLFFVGCGSSEDTATVVESSTPTETKSVKAKTYTLKTTKDETINIELVNDLLLSDELNGKIVLINFWATWCPPCKKEMPDFVKLQKKYKDKFIVVGILMEENKDRAEVQKFLDEFKINFPITVDNDNFKFAKDLGNVKRFPESFLFSKGGLLYKKFIGEVDLRTLESYILDTE